MMKWLRKHTKQIMVVVILLAMFAFVGGTALTNILSPQPANTVFADAFGEKITSGDVSMASRDAQILERIGINWAQLGARATKPGERDKTLRIEHWYLLGREAEKDGVVATPNEVEEYLQNLKQRGVDAAYLNNLRTRDKITIADIRGAVAGFIAIQKNAGRVLAASSPSESQVKHYVRDTGDKVEARFVALQATKFVDSESPLSDERLRSLFEERRNVDAATSDDGIGYRYQPRVNVQYVTASLSQIQKEVDVTFEEVKTYWKKNKGDFQKTEYIDPPAPASKPATTQPAEKPKKIPVQKEKSFSEAKAEVETLLRQAAAKRLAKQAMRKLNDTLVAPWLEEEVDSETGFKPIPAGADDLNLLKDASDRLAKEFNITLTFGETGLMNAVELSQHPELRRIKLAGEGADGMALSDYAFRVPPLLKNEGNRETTTSLQRFQPPDSPLDNSSVFTYGTMRREFPANKLVVFRVVEAHQAEPPAAMEEVRSDVERDLRLLNAFAKAEPIAKEFYTVANRIGLHQALEMFPDLKTKHGVQRVDSPPAFPRRQRLTQAALMEAMVSGETTLGPPPIAGVGSSDVFTDACFEMAAEGWQPEKVEPPVTEKTQAVTTQPAVSPAPKMRLLSVPKTMTWYVIELVNTEKVDIAKYESELRKAAYSGLQYEQLIRAQMAWFDSEKIEKRCGFVRATEDEEVAPDEGIGPTDTPADEDSES